MNHPVYEGGWGLVKQLVPSFLLVEEEGGINHQSILIPSPWHRTSLTRRDNPLSMGFLFFCCFIKITIKGATEINKTLEGRALGSRFRIRRFS